MTAIRHIVFDIGNVLVRWEPDLPYRRLIPDETARRRFLAEICTPDWNREQDRGRGWREAEDALIARHPAEADLIRAYRRLWRDMVPGPVPGTVALLVELIEAGRDVTALTNFAADTYAEAQDIFPFLRRFRGTTVSGEVGLLKPDRAIYERHAADFGLDPAATLLFDDAAANVAGARDAGWMAEVFTDAERMRADLRRHGVTVRETEPEAAETG
jgi:2-haloacid dehalogenase